MKHLARSTLIIAIFFGLEKVLGFVRQILISRTFGRSAGLDAFNAANNVPDMLFALISGGALAMALIPVLAEYLETQGRAQAWELFSRIANLIFIVTASFSVLIAVFADRLVGWNIGIAPGFDPAQQVLVADLMRLNLIATLLFSMAGLVIAGLQANQHFLLPALAPSMYDLGTLVGILILVPGEGIRIGGITLPALGLGIRGLVYGTILGAVLFLGIQIPGLVKYQFRWSPRLSLDHPGIRKVLTVFGPRVLTVFCIQFIFVAQDNLASRLIQGSVTALVYGWLFMQVPESLVGTAIGTALLPAISGQVARNDTEALRHSLNTTIRAILALTIPAAALLSIGIGPLVVILGFDAIGTGLVIWTTRAYLVGLMAYSLIEVTARAFYAHQNARTPLFTIALTALVFIGLAIPLAGWLGAPGIALANSLAFTLQLIVMLRLLDRMLPGFADCRGTLRRVIPATLGSAALVYLAIRFLPIESLGALGGALAAAAILGVGGLLVIPFIWPEIRLMVRL